MPLSISEVAFIFKFIHKLLWTKSMWFIILPRSIICMITKCIFYSSFSLKIEFINISFIIITIFQDNCCIWSLHKRIYWSMINFFKCKSLFWRNLILTALIVRIAKWWFKQIYCSILESIWVYFLFLLGILGFFWFNFLFILWRRNFFVDNYILFGLIFLFVW